jgi:hypothetical protein
LRFFFGSAGPENDRTGHFGAFFGRKNFFAFRQGTFRPFSGRGLTSKPPADPGLETPRSLKNLLPAPDQGSGPAGADPATVINFSIFTFQFS